MERQQRIERDTLGLDVCLPRCLHVDVLEACDRALERSLAAQARSADAPRAPDAPPAPAPTQPPKPQQPITAAQLAQARAMAQSCLPAEPAHPHGPPPRHAHYQNTHFRPRTHPPAPSSSRRP